MLVKTAIRQFLRDVSDNAGLMDVSAFGGVIDIGGGLQIFSNPALCQSAVDALAATIGSSHMSGTLFEYNDSGC